MIDMSLEKEWLWRVENSRGGQGGGDRDKRGEVIMGWRGVKYSPHSIRSHSVSFHRFHHSDSASHSRSSVNGWWKNAHY